jgi:tRNA modification GTPase
VVANPAKPDLIAAIATAAGSGGIGIIRLSGPDLAALASEILGGNEPPPRTATLAYFHARDGTVIDQGIALYFPAPHSFTGEDVLELQGHGGRMVMQMVLSRCLELGARLAEPGEFSRRAFLNGKIDLAQAESLADLIEASTAAAVRSAVRSLTGAFSSEIHGLVQELTDLRVVVEGAIDFSDEDVDFLGGADVPGRLSRLQQKLDSIRARARQGSLLRNGLRVVLAGQPNVGKSSLLNCLAGEDRAIVAELPGTTRDALRETIQIEGIPLQIVDTAGLRDTDDHVERIGISRAWREIDKADAVLLLVDVRQGVTTADRMILERLPPGLTTLTVMNKSDLAGVCASRQEGADGIVLTLSARSGDGVELLRAELLRIAGWQAVGEDVFMARERHVAALGLAQAHIAAGRLTQDRIELFAEELRLAQSALSSITGEFGSDDLLGEIFGRFCIGK